MLEIKKVTAENNMSLACSPDNGCGPDVSCPPDDSCNPTDGSPCSPECIPAACSPADD